MARDEDLSLAMLQGVRLTPVGEYQLSVSGSWLSFHTPGAATLWHSTYSSENDRRTSLVGSCSILYVCTLNHEGYDCPITAQIFTLGVVVPNFYPYSWW